MKSKLWTIFRYELASVVMRKSFLLTLFLLPLISVSLFTIAGRINQKGGSSNAFVDLVAPKADTSMEGIVDASGLINFIPDAAKENIKIFPDAAAAKTAMESGQIRGYYLIPKDYLTRGEVIAYQQDYNIMSGLDSTWVIEETLRSNLLTMADISPEQYQAPLQDLKISVSPVSASGSTPEPRDEDHALNFMVPYIVSLMFYIIIISTSSMLMNSITTEKENRMMEILLTSFDPETMLAGKILSRGVVGLLQFIIWGGTGWLLLRTSGQTFQIPDQFQVPLDFLFWGIAFILLGYYLYAVLMAGVGALAPNMRESSQVTFLFVLPMVVPLMFVSVFSQTPNGGFPVFLSYFPLTSPLAMMMRYSVVRVPIWEMLLSLVVLGITAYVCMRLIAGLFRADVLLSTNSFNIKRYFNAVFLRRR
jgi:ABC-2 type transport system permease protein